jgi:hypothetical protein
MITRILRRPCTPAGSCDERQRRWPVPFGRLLVVGLALCVVGGCSHRETPREAAHGTSSTVGRGPVAERDSSSAAVGMTDSAEVAASATDSVRQAGSDLVGDARGLLTGAGAPARTGFSEATAQEAAAESHGQESVHPRARPGNAETVAESSPSGLRVARAYVCKGIEENEPTEAGKSFIPEEDGILRLCCFSEIEGAVGDDAIYHIWYWGDREMARVELPIRGPTWRTWSSKQIADDWRGEWHVDITDSQGTVLARLAFSVE